MRLNLFLAISLCAASISVQAAEKPDSFGIFEVVDCATAGTKVMVLQRGDSTEKYCLAAQPIVDRTHLKDARSTTNSLGQQVLNVKLTDDGGQRMAKTTQRLMNEGADKGQFRRLAVVIEGKLLAAATLRNVITDELQLTGSFTREELDGIVESLMGPGQRPARSLPKT